MGLDANGTKFLLYARDRGVSFAETAMVGRQDLLVSSEILNERLAAFGLNTNAERLLAEGGGYSEPFLRVLGAEEIVSFDASDYEGASVVHDFNRPIPDEFKGKFSAVIDGGTLEHVFNYPVAIKNCMEMVRVGGHFLSITPANNHLGHGFYQFSPELLYRVFSPTNGFEMVQMMIFEETLNCDWYEVADPDAVKERVILVNDEPSMLLIIAKKTSEADIFSTPPQQSDYSAMWNSGGTAASADGVEAMLGSGVSSFAIRGWKHLQRRFSRSFGMLNRRSNHFRKVDLNGK